MDEGVPPVKLRVTCGAMDGLSDRHMDVGVPPVKLRVTYGAKDGLERPPHGCWCAPSQAEGDVRCHGWLRATATWMKVCRGAMDGLERLPHG